MSDTSWKYCTAQATCLRISTRTAMGECTWNVGLLLGILVQASCHAYHSSTSAMSVSSCPILLDCLPNERSVPQPCYGVNKVSPLWPNRWLRFFTGPNKHSMALQVSTHPGSSIARQPVPGVSVISIIDCAKQHSPQLWVCMSDAT